MEPNQSEPKSLLKDLRNYHVVKVHNPMDKDFTWQVARSIVGADRRHIDPVMEKLNMRNEAHPTVSHVYSKVTVPAKGTLNIPGDVAQVIVKHLVDEIMNKAGHAKVISNPDLRHRFEEEVILNTGDLRSKLSTQTLEDQLAQQISDLNREDAAEVAQTQETQEEVAFPGANATDDAKRKSPAKA